MPNAEVEKRKREIETKIADLKAAQERLLLKSPVPRDKYSELNGAITLLRSELAGLDRQEPEPDYVHGHRF